MNRLVVFLIFVLISSTGLAEGLEVESFEVDNHDIHGSVFPIPDANGDNCALIRVEHNLSEAVHLIDVEVHKREEKAANVIYFYISRWEQSVTISVANYMPVKYKFKESLKSEAVNVLRLSGDGIDTNLLDIPVSISSKPSGATVFIDNIRLSQSTPVSDFFIAGEYPLRIELEDYVTYEDKIIISGSKVEREYELEPNFGYLTVSSNPIDGLGIYLNGEYAGKTPLEIDRCKVGAYQLTSVHDYYKSTERKFTISGGEKFNLSIEAEANFGSIEVVSEPVSGFSVFVNDIYKGETPLTLEKQKFGQYNIRIEHELYNSVTETVSLTRNIKEKVILQADQNYGILNINTASGVDVYLNGKLITSYKSLKLSPQTINLRAEKAKHRTVEKRKILSSGDVINIDLYPEPLLGTILVNPQPKEAEVSITGDSGEYYQDKGICRFVDIPIGEYQLEINHPQHLPYHESLNLRAEERLKLEPSLMEAELGFVLDLPADLKQDLDLKVFDTKDDKEIELSEIDGKYLTGVSGEFRLDIYHMADNLLYSKVINIDGSKDTIVKPYRRTYIAPFGSSNLYVNGKFVSWGSRLTVLSATPEVDVRIVIDGYPDYKEKAVLKEKPDEYTLKEGKDYYKIKSGIALVSDDDAVFHGIKLPIIHTPTYMHFKGLDINWWVAGNSTLDFYPTSDFSGLAVSPVFVRSDNHSGIAVSGFASAGDRFNGILLTGIGGGWDNINGIMLTGGFMRSRANINGLSFSLCYTLIDKDLNGIMMGAVNNCKGTVRGLQIGLYNRTKNLKGVQIGLINTVYGRERFFPFFPIINMHF